MRKRVLTTVLVLMTVVWLGGCGTTYQEARSKQTDDFANGYFTVIAEWGSVYRNYIVYTNDTKVKYFIRESAYQFGITPLYNADGTLQVYEGE